MDIIFVNYDSTYERVKIFSKLGKEYTRSR